MKTQIKLFAWIALFIGSFGSQFVSARTCEEAFPQPFDYKMVITNTTIIRDHNGAPESYDLEYSLIVTKPSKNGSITFKLGGSSFDGHGRYFTRADNPDRLFFSATDAAGDFLNKSFVLQPSTGIVPPPKASFSYALKGKTVSINNLTVNSNDKNLEYRWLFDSAPIPISTEHTPPDADYSTVPAGIYCISLSVAERSGNYNNYDFLDQRDRFLQEVEIKDGISVDISAPIFAKVEQEIPLNILVNNFSTSQLSNVDVTFSYNEEDLELIKTPDTPIPNTIFQNQSFNTEYTFEAKQPGTTVISAEASGTLNGQPTNDTDELNIYVLPNIELELSSPNVAAIGELVEFELEITNHEDFTIENIKVESLVLNTGNPEISPGELLKYISGPLDPLENEALGKPFDLASGESITMTWKYNTLKRGKVDLLASIGFDRHDSDGRAISTVAAAIAIDLAAIALKEVRIVPDRPRPGNVHFLRGKITNIGKFDVESIDFELIDTIPEFLVFDIVIDNLKADISPRIDLLKQNETRTFIIPLPLETLVEDKRKYKIPLKFKGVAVVDGEDVNVETQFELEGNLDRSDYWDDTKESVWANFKAFFWRNFEYSVEFADAIGIGDTQIGRSQAVIEKLQQLGNGILSINDVVISAGENSVVLEEQASIVIAKMKTYYNDTSRKQMAIDLIEGTQNVIVDGSYIISDATFDALDQVVNWAVKVELANERGDDREVARLLTSAELDLSVAFAGEYAVERLGAKLIQQALKRPAIKSFYKRLVKRFGKKPDLDDPVNVIEVFIDRMDKTFDDIKSGVFLNGNDAMLAGVEGDDLTFILETVEKYKDQDVTFFIRPRPATAAKWSRKGYFAKPLKVKFKSVNDIDYNWLGYSELDEGLVVLRQPDDPMPKIAQALKDKKLDIDEDKELINSIVSRYNKKRAEMENVNDWMNDFNSNKKHKVMREDPNNPGQMIEVEIEQPGTVIKRFGDDMIVRAELSPDGTLLFFPDGRPVYSDIDLLSLAKSNGSNLDQALHKKILDDSGYGFDGQHHATQQSSDFPKACIGRKFANQYMAEHSRGQEGLLIINRHGIYKGFVESFSVISEQRCKELEALGLSQGDLYGKIVESVSYTRVPVK